MLYVSYGEDVDELGSRLVVLENILWDSSLLALVNLVFH